VNIVSLEIRNLRVIRRARIDPGPHVNFLIGGNGAGKTSFLEAIFLLARGRTFRSSRCGALLTTKMQKLSLKGHVEGENICGAVELVFVEGRKQLFVNGRQVQRMRDLRDRIHVRVIAENSQRLLEGEPAIRRLFLDWNLFHVEHNYSNLHSSFRRTLDQRNAWLRKGGGGLRVWDDAYIDLSEKLTAVRERYTEELSEELAKLHGEQRNFPILSARLSKGWPPELALGDALSSSLFHDVRRGFTRFGPARADLRVSVGGSPGIGSRGQVKISVCLLQLAAQRVQQARSGRACVWLLDDLAAELDNYAFMEIFNAFVGADAQIFLSARQKLAIEESIIGRDHCRVFHVEHGKFSP
jgi:DNA replication and repair protein RecF